MLIDGGECGSGGGSSECGSSGGSGEDVGKLTRKRLNRGLPGRKQGTVRIQVAWLAVTIGLQDSKDDFKNA